MCSSPRWHNLLNKFGEADQSLSVYLRDAEILPAHFAFCITIISTSTNILKTKSHSEEDKNNKGNIPLSSLFWREFQLLFLYFLCCASKTPGYCFWLKLIYVANWIDRQLCELSFNSLPETSLPSLLAASWQLSYNLVFVLQISAKVTWRANSRRDSRVGAAVLVGRISAYLLFGEMHGPLYSKPTVF